MEDRLLSLAVVGIAFYIAWSVGSNDETMAPLAGCGFVTVDVAALLGAITAFCGAVLFSSRVEETISKEFLIGAIDTVGALIVVFSIAAWLTLCSYRGWPASTTHSTVGATIGLGLVKWGTEGVFWSNVGIVATLWLVSPLMGFFGAVIASNAIRRVLRKRVTGLRRQMIIASKSAFILLFLTCFTSFSRGGNDVANATAFLSAMLDRDPLLIRTVGGIGVALGLLMLGRRVIKSVGLKITKLDPTAALAAQLSTFLVVFLGTWLGVPMSSTHVLVGALAGLGLEREVWINVRRLRETLYVWLTTFIVTATISVITYFLIASLQ